MRSCAEARFPCGCWDPRGRRRTFSCMTAARSEEHTSELQSRSDLVCRLLLEKKKKLTEISTTFRRWRSCFKGASPTPLRGTAIKKEDRAFMTTERGTWRLRRDNGKRTSITAK